LTKVQERIELTHGFWTAAQWNKTIPVTDKNQWRDPSSGASYQRAALASDPTSNSRQPPVCEFLRIPIGKLQPGACQKYWRAADITVLHSSIRGERDFWSRPETLRRYKPS
jgi:hypothetical protein